MASSNKLTREYRSVQKNLCRFIGADSEATDTLTLKFQEVSWLGVDCGKKSAADLVRSALCRIDSNVGQYYLFMDMLRNTVGMDLILEDIEGLKPTI